MLEALWSVEFVSNLQILGGGVAVLETGRVLGGDSQYIYVGSYAYEPNGDTLKVRIKVTHHSGPAMSIFGQAREFNLELSGKPQRDTFQIQGHVVERPELKIAIRLTRRAELP